MPVEQPKLAATAFLIADPARAAMLMALIDGRALPAGELAFAGGVTPQTASSHLAKLLDGGLLAVEAQGRHRYYRLAGSHVAFALENLATLAAPAAPRCRKAGHKQQSLSLARCCYDHLAGRLGVAVAEALEQRALIARDGDKRYVVTTEGATWFAQMGLDVSRVASSRRGIARQCLDWTERKHHLAGSLGVELLALLCAKRWLRRSDGSRAIHITDSGWAGLHTELGIHRLTGDELALDP
ncbi:ArsR/SmtB family transcription factor [Xanthomonas translucens]|uniref:ArsR/SmtB family transcription factor n=1 Tax=Xanthomonas campestris pv. translucens TaxID=343 RepID=UPI0002A79C70|nr:helix-turn-helix transcriptional regulator [Xanthomonas translucens]AKK66797.1 ArsR family transcriptional regulator [Xanthomonas translucens pv. undulosa]AVY65661.1 ArsR family transcriptional regulator [Xanthomonas translucens pv. undulosa]ELQ09776.1 ArsR family transcriptional regulator [Xanthomonas translucens DAR61454]MBC3970776.1 helix-turn-helix transcriptional regulator [Xanthomonas translucens pv. undulosa]MCT8270828.1 ArsR family transcriptional regulator [Xanthomonas translucens 